MRIFKQTDDVIEFVQIYGERNSGTNYLSKMLQENLRDSRNLLGLAKSEALPYGTQYFGYKHWFLNWEMLADIRQNRTLFVVIYRNPYTWVRAMMTRPYALAKSIGGCTVKNLPKVKLSGHINGKDTLNEFHPVTGQKLTLFELRKLKIEHFETLKKKVGNTVYINMEDLVEHPSETMQTLAREFESAFVRDLTFNQVLPRQLVRESRKPELFSQDESEVLNDSIEWDVENAIGYKKGNYFVGELSH